MMPSYRVRPTALLPIWDIAGFAIGAGSALIGGKEGAMACTVAVETVITEHYNDQVTFCGRVAYPPIPQLRKSFVCLSSKIVQQSSQKNLLYSKISSPIKLFVTVSGVSQRL